MPRKQDAPSHQVAGNLNPAKQKRSLYMGHWADRMLAPAENASAALETICRRFYQFTLGATPKDYSPSEWAVLVLALRDGAGHAEFDAWRVALGWAHAYRGYVEEVYGVDAVEVARKLKEAGEVTNIAVCQAVDNYWQIQGKPGHAERLEAMGLVTSKEVRDWRATQGKRDAALEAERRKHEAAAKAAKAAARRRPARKA